MTGFLGLDVPPGGTSTNVPAVELDLALDPTQNFTHNTSEMSARNYEPRHQIHHCPGQHLGEVAAL